MLAIKKRLIKKIVFSCISILTTAFIIILIPCLILLDYFGTDIDVGADIFQRGLCLPSDNKMTAEQQDKIIDVIHKCFQ